MSIQTHDVFQKFTALQDQIWQTVAGVLSESVDAEISATAPSTFGTTAGELATEFSLSHIVIQFSFANSQDNPQLILISQDSFAELLSMIAGSDVNDVDESLVLDNRSLAEAIVQGVCVATGTSRKEAVAAGGLTLRMQIPSLPPNLLRAEDLIRTDLVFVHDKYKGGITWIVDAETAAYVLGLEDQDLDSSSSADLSSAESGAKNGDSHALEILLDIPLDLSVELGRVKMLIKDVVGLGTGSIIEIDKAAGEPVDVMVNGRIVARGEVVVIEDNFGVRITEILSPQERLMRLNEVA